MPHRLYQEVAQRADFLCEYCLAPEPVFNQEFEVDHIISLAHKGSDTFDNLALCCRSCNVRKGDAELARDPATGQMIALFHPRLDRWDAHFSLNVSTFEIEGRTATGRATVARLGMNRQKARTARAHWLTLGALGQLPPN
jgi:hypothetical protein